MHTYVQLSGNRNLLAAHSLAPQPSRCWVVYLPESGSEFQHGTRRDLQRLIGGKIASKFNYLALNKPGMDARRTDRGEFEASFRRWRRVRDALRTMEQTIPPGDNIYLVGYSEGAYLAPEVALKDPRVKAVMMIGGGTRGWLKEEWNNAQARGKAALAREILKVQSHPKSQAVWRGFSCATWNSYASDRTLQSLKKLKCPVLALVGGRDRVIDLKTTVQDLTRLSQTSTRRVRLVVLEDCGHSFAGHWDDVRRHLEGFLLKT